MIWMLFSCCQGRSLGALVPASPWSRRSESYSKSVHLAAALRHLEIACSRPVIMLARGGCSSLPLLQQFDLLFDVVVPICLPVLLGPSAAVLALSLRQVPALAALGVLREELLVAAVEDVHLGVEELGVLLHVQVPIQVTQLGPEQGRSLLAELAVEDQDGSLRHQVPDAVEVLKEGVLEQRGAVDVLSSLNVAGFEFIVPSAVDDDVGAALLPHEEGESRRTDRVHFGLVCLRQVQLLEE